MRSSRNFDVVRRGLAQVWDAQGRRFATFEALVGDRPDADRWVQYLDGELNVSWPFPEEPTVVLARAGVALPTGAFVAWHAAGSNAVIALGDSRIDDVARLVEALFVRVLAGGDAEIVARIDDHR